MEVVKERLIAIKGYYLPESTSSPISQRIEDDKVALLILLERFNIASVSSKVIRLGKMRAKNPRPLKIIFKSKAKASNLLESFNEGRQDG